MSLHDRIIKETQITKLKLLAVEANNSLPVTNRITGYTKYKLAEIEELRKRLLASLGSAPPIIVPSLLSPPEKKDPFAGLPPHIRAILEKARIPPVQPPSMLPPVKPSSPPVKPSSPPVKPSSPPEKKDPFAGLPPHIRAILERQKPPTVQPPLMLPPLKPPVLPLPSKLGSRPLSTTVPPFNGCIGGITKLTTTAFEDYNNLTFVKFEGSVIDKCLDNFGIKATKKGGSGSYGTTYIDKYNGENAIFKVVKFPNDFGVEGFKWECVLSERAGKLGVGPIVLEKSVCYAANGVTPKFGVIVLGKCVPLSASNKSSMNGEELYRMVETLHANGIVHKDLGERNIMMSGKSYVFIDYGLALAYPGVVPPEMSLYDHAYLAGDIPRYKTYLKSKKDSAYMAKVNTLAAYSDDDNDARLRLEEMTIRNFPIEMMRTLGLAKTSMYLNNLITTSLATIGDRQLKKRFESLGIPEKL